MPAAIIPDSLLTREIIADRLDLLEETYAHELCKPEGEKNHQWIKDAKARITTLNELLKNKKP